LGLHYPTDIIVGAIIGIAICWVGNRIMVKGKIAKFTLNWAQSKPGLFYILFFFITEQIVNLFGDSRDILHAIGEALERISH
jgi:undecaprenyl-diphosphatase